MSRTKQLVWTKDELILALDLYFRHHPSHISKTHKEVIALSETLRRLPIHPQCAGDAAFRSPASVYMKLQNLHHLDPSSQSKGLKSTATRDEEVWNEFAHDRARLERAAAAIIRPFEEVAAANIETHTSTTNYPEGRVLYELHRRGEGVIECHHRIPVSQMAPDHKTRLHDLALVCSNCHSILHRGGEALTVERLRGLVRSR